MNYKKTIGHSIWSKPDEKGRVRRIGQRTNGEVFDELKSRLEEAGLLPDEYFLMSSELRKDGKIPDFYEAECYVNYGGSEGIYVDVELKYVSPDGERIKTSFATGKTLGEKTADFYRMSLIAGECSMLLNGDGFKIRNNTKSVLILDEEEADILTNSLQHLASFNNIVGRSNSEVFNLLQAVNPEALNNYLENANENGNDEELEE